MSIEDFIDYIRARVEIEEERRARNFEKNFAIVGVGFATAEIVGGFSWTRPEEEEAVKHPLGVVLKRLNVPDYYVAPAITAYFSISLGFIAGVLTWLVIRQRRKAQRERKKH